MSMPEIVAYPESEYISSITTLIAEKINQLISTRGHCSVMLTGGRTAEALYRFWSDQQLWDHTQVSYYFGDERCVSPEDVESNFGMVRSALFLESPIGDP